MPSIIKIEMCITKFPKNIAKNDFLVIYKNTEPSTFVKAYLTAAERIITEFGNGKISASDDMISLPLLNLYVNTLEFSLKYYIEEVERHRQKKVCNCIKPPPNGFEKIVYSSHNLSDLVDIIKHMQPDSGQLHSLPELGEIEEFVCGLMNIGVRSESTRYIHDSTKKIYELYSQQLWIYPRLLHSSVKEIVDCLLGAVSRNEFQLCGVDEFSKTREAEISGCISLINQMDSVLQKFTEHSAEQDSGPVHYYSGFKEESFVNRQTRISEFRKALDNLDHSQLAILCMGLYFTRDPLQIENIGFFEEWTKDQLELKILERAHDFVNAKQGLDTHLELIKTKRKLRGF